MCPGLDSSSVHAEYNSETLPGVPKSTYRVLYMGF